MKAKELDPTSMALLCLAAPPIWTDSIARALPSGSSFPVDDLRAYVDEAVDSGVAERRRTLDASGNAELRFWVTPIERHRILERLQTELGPQEVIDASSALARSVLDLESGTVELPPALRDWASLTAAAETDGNPSVQLLDHVRAEVEDGHLARAQEWCAVGEALTPLFRGAMEVALARSNRVIERGYRQRADEALLGRYLRRPSIDDAVLRMLNARDASWLHLHGPGGVGKSMLVRDLGSGRFAEHHYRNEPLVVARVDFDLLDPEFPVRQPAQLLLALADDLGLAAATNPDADAELTRFHPAAIAAHEALSAMRGRNISLDDTLEHPAVGEAIDRFADTVAAFGSRVLLVLDTCEELAKAYPGYEVSPAVEATYRILDRVRSRASDVRVLFCGRRTLPPHAGLADHHLQGFDADEARMFLRAATTVELDDDLVAAILEQSPAVDEPDRYNPFDLDMYLSWIVDAARTDEEPVDANVVRSGGRDAYVERRIVQRLRTSHQRIDWQLLDALPAITALGVVTRETLAAVTGDEGVDEVFAELAKQEWVGRDHSETGTLAVKSGMLRRLRSYYGAEARADLVGRSLEGLAARLAASLGDPERARLPEDGQRPRCVADLRPWRGRFLWERSGRPGRARRRMGNWMLKTAAAVDGASAEEQWPSRPALAGHRHGRRVRRVPANPALVRPRRIVVTRARHAPATIRMPHAGRVGGACRAGPLPTARPRCAGEPRVIAAAVDAVDRSTETGDDEPALAIIGGATLRRCPRGCRRRGAAPLGRQPGAPDVRRRPPAAAVDRSRRGPSTPGPAYPDWLPPRDLGGRIALEQAIWARCGRACRPDEVPLDEWERYVSDHLDQIDGDRLASACLRLRLAWRPLTADELAGVRNLPYVPGLHATCRAHEIVPPFFATVAEGLLGVGEAEAAMRLLDSFRSSAVAGRRVEVDAGTQLAADVAAVSIARQLRDPSSPVVRRSTGHGCSRLGRATRAIRALVVLGGPERPSDGRPRHRQRVARGVARLVADERAPDRALRIPAWSTSTPSEYALSIRGRAARDEAVGARTRGRRGRGVARRLEPSALRRLATRRRDRSRRSAVDRAAAGRGPSTSPSDGDAPALIGLAATGDGPGADGGGGARCHKRLAGADAVRRWRPTRSARPATRRARCWPEPRTTSTPEIARPRWTACVSAIARSSAVDTDDERSVVVLVVGRSPPGWPVSRPRSALRPHDAPAAPDAPERRRPATRDARSSPTSAPAVLVVGVWVLFGWLIHLGLRVLFGDVPILVTHRRDDRVARVPGLLAEAGRGGARAWDRSGVARRARVRHERARRDDPASAERERLDGAAVVPLDTSPALADVAVVPRRRGGLPAVRDGPSTGCVTVAHLDDGGRRCRSRSPPDADAKWWSTAETAARADRGATQVHPAARGSGCSTRPSASRRRHPSRGCASCRSPRQRRRASRQPGTGALLVASGAWTHQYAGYSTSLPEGSRPRLVHLVGNVVDTTSGPRFERAEESSYGSQSTAASPSYLAGAEIARRWERPDLVVVQPPPVDVIRSRPSATDLATRSNFAQELLDAGVPAVVLLPEVVDKGSPALAEAFLAAISRRLLLTVPALQRLAGDVRAVVREHAAADSLDDVIVMLGYPPFASDHPIDQGGAK